MPSSLRCNLLIVGGGLAGSTLGSLVKKYKPSASILLIERSDSVLLDATRACGVDVLLGEAQDIIEKSGRIVGARVASTGENIMIKSQLLADCSGRSGFLSKFRTIRDRSCFCKAAAGDGWIAAGDAAVFVDPVFSSGAEIARLTAQRAANTIATIVAGAPQALARALWSNYSVYCRETAARLAVAPGSPRSPEEPIGLDLPQDDESIPRLLRRFSLEPIFLPEPNSGILRKALRIQFHKRETPPPAGDVINPRMIATPLTLAILKRIDGRATLGEIKRALVSYSGLRDEFIAAECRALFRRLLAWEALELPSPETPAAIGSAR